MTRNAPDSAWIPFIRVVMGYVIGFTLMTFLGLLARGLAIHDIDPTKSPGLEQIIGALTLSLGIFAKWAWDSAPKSPKDDDPEEK